MTRRDWMRLFWAAFLIVLPLVAIAIFSVGEHDGLSREDSLTLSRFIVDLSKAWPPLPFFAGLFLGLFEGGLAVHFWWHWAPERDWQPIASAPRDGRYIVVTDRSRLNAVPTVVQWRDGRWRTNAAEFPPTHWMSLDAGASG